MPLVIKNFKLLVVLLLCGLLQVGKIQAQSLGDPVVKITFGSGTPIHGPALAADSGSTSYIYTTGIVDENYYTIANQVNTTTHSMFITGTDHTGNANGYMMIINGNEQAGTVFTRKVPGLCGNTTYQFGVWIENVLSTSGTILPNMVFHVYSSDGVTELGSGISTGDVTNRTWKFFSANFTLPAGADGVVIKLVSNASGRVGNDFAIDDLTFSPYDATSLAIAYDATTDASVPTCAGTTQTYKMHTTSALSAGYVQKLQGYINGTWVDQSTPGTATSFTITPPAIAGTYYYRVVAALADNIGSVNCVTNSNQLTLNVLGAAPAVFSYSGTPCLGTAIVFKDQSVPTGTTITSWLWDFGDNTSSNLQNPSPHIYTAASDFTPLP